MIDVTIVMVEGGLASSVMAPLEVFGCAGLLWAKLRGEEVTPYFRVRTASVDGREPGNLLSVPLRPDLSLAQVGETDLVLIPTGGLDYERTCAENGQLLRWLRERYGRGVAVAGVCTGVPLLAAAGLLDGLPATTHWAAVDRCRALYPRVRWTPEHLITESNNIFCGGGLYASVDLSLYLVERYCGHEVAVQTAKAMVLEMPRAWQSAFAAEPPASGHGDALVLKAQHRLLSQLADHVDLNGLASEVGLSPRQLARRFRAATGDGPLAYLHRLRIDRARHLLENAHRSVQEVSFEVGYDDVAFFRSLFRRHTGTSPKEYRERFGLRGPRAVFGTAGPSAPAGTSPERSPRSPL